jgi:benzoate membrane transport protein
MRASMISAAVVAALVGYGSTITVVLAAAAAVGASPGQTASWVLALCLAKAAGSALLSGLSRVPVLLAWSTPGAALIAATSGVTLAEAVGAFLLAAALIALTGALAPLGRVVAAIPDGIAAGMLAGVLLPFVTRLAGGIAATPALVLPVIAAFALVRPWNPSFAVLAALALGLGLGLAQPGVVPISGFAPPRLDVVAPAFDPAVLIGLGLPLYLVTMASQNLPGFATLRAAGYDPPVRPALAVTGGLSALAALFGAHSISMAAITAAICLGDDVHPDRSRRWQVGLVFAAVWVCLGVLSPVLIGLTLALPAALIAVLVALALLGPLTGALAAAVVPAPQRFAATATLVVTAGGVAFLGVGAAFWGLAAGLAVFGFDRLVTRPHRPRA